MCVFFFFGKFSLCGGRIETARGPLCGRSPGFLRFSSDYGGNNFYNPFLSARRIFPGKTYIYFLPEVPNLICAARFSHCFIYFINNMSSFPSNPAECLSVYLSSFQV